jgi:hypothetical protein
MGNMSSTPRPEPEKFCRTVELEAGPNQRLELEVSHREGKRELTLRELSWGNGVGWFVQKSIHLDSLQVESLLKGLCCLREPARAPGAGCLYEPASRGASAPAGGCPLLAAEPKAGGGAGEILKVDFREV